jgi:hypothetical protein
MKRATQVAIGGFLALAVFEIALATGAPLGEAAWGGSRAELTNGQRLASAAAAAFWCTATLIVRGRGAGRAERRYRWGTWTLVAVLGISALLNAASESAWDNLLLAPLALLLAVACAVLAYEAGVRTRESVGTAVGERGLEN